MSGAKGSNMRVKRVRMVRRSRDRRSRDRRGRSRRSRRRRGRRGRSRRRRARAHVSPRSTADRMLAGIESCWPNLRRPSLSTTTCQH